ncbi:MAG: hypothetical protein OXC48_02330, partial [Endozoicomonadaceae bacterium]|nr:hypothetical protein [Endozoicomonadaceae bacterium]
KRGCWFKSSSIVGIAVVTRTINNKKVAGYCQFHIAYKRVWSGRGSILKRSLVHGGLFFS